MPQWAVMITYREVFSAEPSIDDLSRILSKYQRAEVLFLLAKLNCLLGTWQNEPNFELDSRLSGLLMPSYRSQIEAIRRNAPNKLLFTRLSILFLVKQACLVCLTTGSPTNTPAALEELGICSLMANDLVLMGQPRRADNTLQRLASMMPFCDYLPQDEYPIDIARALMMFEETSKADPLKARGDFIDIESLFKDRVGLTPFEFCALAFGAATKFLNLKTEDLERSPEALLLRPEYFRLTKLPAESLAQFFTKIAVTETEFAKQVLESRNRPGDDLTIIQKFPVIEPLKGLYSCLDPGFLVDKAGKSLYWTLFAEIQDRKEQQKLAGFWGTVFEQYVNSILGGSYSAGGKFIASAKFANGDEAFDACIIERSTLVAFEHKSSVLRADAKYGGDIKKLETDLRKKFIEGEEDGAKGLAQLERGIRRFLEGQAIDGVDPKNIKTIYPVLVCLDRSMLSLYVNKYLNENFDGYSLRKAYRKIVAPVFSVSVSEVENLLGYLQKFRISDVLESYYKVDRKLFSSLSSSGVPLLKDAEPANNPIRERFSEFGRRIEGYIFGPGADGTPTPRPS